MRGLGLRVGCLKWPGSSAGYALTVKPLPSVLCEVQLWPDAARRQRPLKAPGGG